MRSKYERRVASRLDALGIPYEYEAYKLQYWLTVPGARCATCNGNAVQRSYWYTPDFWLPDYNCFLETKGRFLSKDRTKMKAVLDQHPEESLIMVFMANNKIHPSSNTRYTDWCLSNRIPFMIAAPSRSGQVPAVTEKEIRHALAMYK